MQLILTSYERNRYLLKGDTQALLSNRRSKIALRNLKYEVAQNGDVSIFSEESIDRIANIVKLSAKYIKADVSFDGSVSSDISEYNQRMNEFEEWSLKAKDIKENNCVISDFDEFTDSLKKNMLNRTLYPLQLLASYHLAFSQNGCNFSVPGAGKTSIVYGAYTYLKNLKNDDEKKVDKLLIIGPLSSFGPWQSEYKECFGTEPSCKRINGALNQKAKQSYFYEDDPCELTLISYASLVSVKDNVSYFLKSHRVMVVLDEAHKIKNTNGGITAQSIMELASLCNSRVVLTGTPAPNGYEDLYNLFHFIWPKNDVVKYTIAQLKEMSRTQGDTRVPALMKNLDPYFIRIKKSNLGLQPPIENPPLVVDMSDSQRRIYDYIEEQFVEEVESVNGNIHSALVKAKMIRLQQAASNPALLRQPLSEFLDDEGKPLDNYDDSDIMRNVLKFNDVTDVPSKFKVCADLVEKIISSGGKVVIWAIFIKSIEMLQSYLASRHIESKALYGATPVATDGMSIEDEGYEETREGIIKTFHREDSPFKVIIANPFAVAESISLHKVCHNAIYLERSFNCAHFMQSKDRIHRYGLKPGTETYYYYILSRNSIDEVINNRLILKEERMTQLIESMPIPLFDNLGDGGDADIKAIIEAYAKRKS